MTYFFRPRNWTDVSPQHNYYFTLIELLVVIAIMVILLGLALPVFEKVLESSRTVSCINQEKQLYLALMQYAYDYEGYIPSSIPYSPTDPWYWAHVLEVSGYISGRSKMVLCPTTRRSTTASRNIAMNSHLVYYLNLGDTYRPSWLYLAMDTRGGDWYTVSYRPGYPHDNKCNIIFIDGHAKTHPFGTVGNHTWGEPNRLPWYNRRGWNPSGPQPW